MSKYGSLQNRIGAGQAGREPEVGMGATIYMWSDRSPATVIAVERFKSGARKGEVKAITLQEDKATRIDENGMSDAQAYTFERDPLGAVHYARVRKDGRFETTAGRGVSLGGRSKYYDYSF